MDSLPRKPLFVVATATVALLLGLVPAVAGAAPAHEPARATVRLPADALPPLAAGTVTISGTPRVDQPLTAVAKGWPTGTTLRYQWYENGVPMRGWVSDRFTPRYGQLGSSLAVEVTGSRDGYAPRSVMSKATPLIVINPPDRTMKNKALVSLKAYMGVVNFRTLQPLLREGAIADVAQIAPLVIEDFSILYNTGAPPKLGKKAAKAYLKNTLRAARFSADAYHQVVDQKFVKAKKSLKKVKKLIPKILKSINKGYGTHLTLKNII